MASESSPLVAAAAAGRWKDHLAAERLPRHLATPCRRWLSLLAFSAISAISSGPIAMWPTLVPMFVEEGTLAGPNQLRNLSMINVVSMALSTGSSFFLGIFYDRVGPRTCAVGGALGGGGAMLLMAAAMRTRGLNWVLFLAYPLATILSMLNTMGTFAWLWLLPGNANVVNSVAMAIQTLSDSLVLVLVWLHRRYNVSLELFFCALAALSVLSATVSWALVPPHEAHRRYVAATVEAERVKAEAAAAAAEAEAAAPSGAAPAAAAADDDEETGVATAAAAAIKPITRASAPGLSVPWSAAAAEESRGGAAERGEAISTAEERYPSNPSEGAPPPHERAMKSPTPPPSPPPEVASGSSAVASARAGALAGESKWETENDAVFDEPPSSSAAKECCGEARAVLRVVALYPGPNGLFVLFCLCTYSFILYGYSNQFTWYSTLFGAHRAKVLVNTFALIYSVCR